jgi:hypothetical protein
MYPSSSPFSCRFSLIPNFTPIIIPSVVLPFFFSLFDLPDLYSFDSDFSLCASFPVCVFFVHLTFYSPSLCTFSRPLVFSSSLLLLKFFLQFLLSLIPYFFINGTIRMNWLHNHIPTRLFNYLFSVKI